MATRAPQAATFAGAALTLHAAASGDKVSAIRRPTSMLVINDGEASVTLTVTVPGKTVYGEDNPDKAFTIPAETTYLLELLPEYANPADSYLIALSWSATTDVSWAVIG